MKPTAPLRILIVAGTRPEVIKLVPLWKVLRERPQAQVTFALTGQHRELARSALTEFGLTADVDLDVMQPDQTLAALTARLLTAIDGLLERQQPDCMVVQGDTTTVLAASLAAFYCHTPVVHVEAGLRTGDLQAPWPEELNRRAVALMAALHCAPTERAAAQLLSEGVPADRIAMTGNTVVDALQDMLKSLTASEQASFAKQSIFVPGQKLVLVTGHRRENFGAGLEHLCTGLRDAARVHPDAQFLYAVHLNPRVREPVERLLSRISNIRLQPPAGYREFVCLLNKADLIVTDSGGVQEEAISLGKRVLVTREVTERMEGVDVGLAELVGTDPARIAGAIARALKLPASEAPVNNPYGDGHAAERIAELILTRFSRTSAAR